MLSLINKERITKEGVWFPSIYTDESSLRFGSLEHNTNANWTINGTTIEIRIPWSKINFTDPSSMRVLDDSRKVLAPLKDELNTTITDGILVSGVIFDRESNLSSDQIGAKNDPPFRWKNWDVPTYEERTKDSYAIIREFLGTIP
jgi:hypothetical protein